MRSADNPTAALLEPFHDVDATGVRISAHQGSRFAKAIAGDHNPIHDIDAPRFCVPGDLLFALIAGRYGLAQRVQLTFRGMLRADTPLWFPEPRDGQFSITDAGGREYVTAQFDNPLDITSEALRGLIETYVGCSGKTFPDLMVPLLEEHGVMFNPDRPLVVYDRMEIRLSAAPTSPPTMALESTTLTVSQKRGDARFGYRILEADRPIGTCSKQMVVSGLRPYDHERMNAMVERYHQMAALGQA